MASRLMQFFSYAHLPERLQSVSSAFCALAEAMDESLPENAEKTVALRKLLESKDCAVRSVLYREPELQRPEPTSVPGPGKRSP